MVSPEDKKDPLEKISQNLYRNDGVVTKHRPGVLHKQEYDIRRDWGEGNHEEEEPSPHVPFLKKLFIGSAIFFAVSLIFSLAAFFGGRNIVSNKNIDLSILGPAFVEGGNEIELEFDIRNKNNQGLEYADLIVEYPRGATLEGDNNVARIRQFVGDIGAGNSASKRAKITLFGAEGSERTVRATLEYRIQGSNAIFVKESEYVVHVTSSPISLSISGMKEANSGQEIFLEVEVLANAEKIVGNMMLRVEYPSGFSLGKPSPDTSFGNNAWRLGDLEKGTRKKITIRGTLSGEDGEERSFRIYAGREDDKNQGDIGVVYGSILHTISIKRPFIEAKLLINDESGPEISVPASGRINGVIYWTNNVPGRVLDAEISVQINGTILDKKSVSAVGAFYSSSDSTLTWNKDTSPSLTELEGGDSGQFNFSFNILPLSSGNQGAVRNPSLTLNVSVQARRIGEGNVPEEISSSEKKTIKVSSNVQLSAVSSYYSGPFKNFGVIPPRADKETTYTVTWSVSNSSNDLSHAKVKTILPSYVRFTENTSPSDENISYNSVTREVIWDIGRLEAGTGITISLRKVSFQLGVTPSTSQIGAPAPITGSALFEAEDTFSKALITSSVTALSTKLSGDTGVRVGDDIIQK
ncbi:MAG: hypothetical protein AAB355_02755 [Patescibacteria group bacterium]